MSATIWRDRAAAAEDAVLARHVRRLWGLPGVRLGVVGWPASPMEQLFGRWHYWWQAHLLDCLIDAQLRAPGTTRTRLIRDVSRGQLVRNYGRWTNNYYDDMAWLGLALERGQRFGMLSQPRALGQLTSEILGAWSDAEGGIPWRRRDGFRNVPANGPAAILLARLGHPDQARRTVNWIVDTLLDGDTGLVLDGVFADGRLAREIYSYSQGVVLGALIELVVHAGDRAAGYEQRADQLVTAVDRHLADDHVLRGHGGGDGGLFTGILGRYLTLTANLLPTTTAAGQHAVHTAATLVRHSAAAAWANAATVQGRPVFGPDWSIAATAPSSRTAGRRRTGSADSSPDATRDLSVQLGGWMLTEAVAALSDR